VHVNPADCPASVAKRITGNLKKVVVTGITLPLFAGILDVDHLTLCPPAMILKDDTFWWTAGLFGRVQQAREHPHGVKKQTRIGGRMDVGFNGSTIYACLTRFFGFFSSA
jgi:hypothetical protein